MYAVAKKQYIAVNFNNSDPNYINSAMLATTAASRLPFLYSVFLQYRQVRCAAPRVNIQ